MRLTCDDVVIAGINVANLDDRELKVIGVFGTFVAQ